MGVGIGAVGERARRAIAAVGALALVIAGTVLLSGPTEARALDSDGGMPGVEGPGDGATAQAAPLAASPFDWELPDGVQLVGQVLFRVDDEGEVIGTGLVSPGRTFFYAFRLQNTGEDPVTVTGFESNFTIVMHPDRQGDFPADHCLQFFETRDFGERQAYPQVIEPGQTVTFGDNETYHYVWGPPSNECQQAAFYFGPPTFQIAEVVSPEQPAWREATCDVPGAVVIPETRGVDYAIDGAPAVVGEHEIVPGSSVTVTASPAEGFEFPDGTVAEWSHTFAEPDCDGDDEGDQEAEGDQDADGDAGAAGSGASGNAETSGRADASATTSSADGTVTTSAGTVADTRLAATGGSNSMPLWAGGALAALLGTAMLIRSRRGTRQE